MVCPCWITHSVCDCSTHQNAVLLVDAIDWECTYKDQIEKAVMWVMSGKYCFEKVPVCWARSSRHGLWISFLTVANNRSCCSGYTYNSIRRIQGTPQRQHQQTYSTLVPGEIPNKIHEIEEEISRWERGYGAWGLCRELSVYDPGQDAKLPLEQRVLHIASTSHLLQICWWKPPTLFPLFHFRGQHTRHQFCSQDSDTIGGIFEAEALERHKDLLRFWWLWWTI